MFGLGIGLFIVIVLIAVGHRTDGISTGNMWMGIVIGLLLASVVPGLPNNVHDFVSNSVTSIQHANTNK